MNKRIFWQTLIATIVVTVFIVVAFGGFISAKLSTLPALRKFHLLTPQAPIVIDRKEEVRVSDSGDVQQAVSTAKSKIVSIATSDGSHVTILGSALTLTSDGLFVTSKAAVSNFQAGKFFILSDSNDPISINQVILDPATNLALAVASGSNLPVVDFFSSKDMTPGQKIVFLAHGELNFIPQIQAGFIAVGQQDLFGQVLHAGFPVRSFSASSSGSLVPGEAVISIDGSFLGLWDGTQVVSSDVVKSLMDSYFANKNSIARAEFDFDYKVITRNEAGLLKLSEGAQVVKVNKKDANGHATAIATAGLTEGDIITQVNDSKIDQDLSLEEVLEKVKPGDNVAFTVVRGKQTLVLNFTPGSLK